MCIFLPPLKIELKEMKEKREKLAHLAYMVSNVEVGVHVLRHIAFLVSDEAAVFHRTFKEIP